MRIDQGKRYRYSPKGEIRTHRNLIGVASNVECLSAVTYSCTLSNLTGWTKLGIATQITALSTELEPVESEPEPAPTKPLAPFDGIECDLVALIEYAAQARGYLVAKVGQHRADGSGTTVGYPDLSVRRSGWPCGMACLIEVKTKGGRLSTEQEKLFDAGWSYVVWSVEGAMEALDAFEEQVAHWTHWSHHKPTTEVFL
jgi:hypothetical protein